MSYYVYEQIKYFDQLYNIIFQKKKEFGYPKNRLNSVKIFKYGTRRFFILEKKNKKYIFYLEAKIDLIYILSLYSRLKTI